MKTDPFDDAIRRKLEAVDPPFQEKNWTQFQRFMGVQGFPPSLWQTPARWLQPALMAAAVAGVVITTSWQYQTTKSLNDHVQTLTKTVERLQQTQVRLQESVSAMATASARVDTVYLTRSVQQDAYATRSNNVYPVPHEVSRQSVNSQLSDRPFIETNETVVSTRSTRSDRSTQSRRTDNRVNSQKQSATNQFAATSPTKGNQRTILDQHQSANDQLEAGQPQLAVDPLMAGKSSSTTNSILKDQSSFGSASTRSIPIPPESGRAATRRTGKAGMLETNNQPIDYQTTSLVNRSPKTNDPTLYSPSITNQSGNAEPTPVNPSITASGVLATVQPLVPLAFPGQSQEMVESWQRHLRRVRYRSPYMTSLTPTAAAEPALPENRTTPLPIQFRVGAGGEVGTVQSGVGVYAEVIVANRWTIGTGLSHISWAGDTYQTEQVFMNQTKRDFRRDYPGTAKIPIGPGRPPEVMDINRAVQSLVIPLQAGYRIGLGNKLVLTPFVGLNLSVNPRETVTYAYDYYKPINEIQEHLTVKRPQLWYSNWTTGVSVERQWGRLTGQVSPVILLPLTDIDACLNSASVGFRGRLFFRF